MHANQTHDHYCLNCQKLLEGRKGKLYCSNQCRSSFHYRENKSALDSMYVSIDRILKRNRALLKHFNAGGKSVIRKQLLLQKGFNPKYFTHYWKNKKGDVYLFCYEFGFLTKIERGIEKYILVKWQAYMDD